MRSWSMEEQDRQSQRRRQSEIEVNDELPQGLRLRLFPQSLHLKPFR